MSIRDVDPSMYTMLFTHVHCTASHYVIRFEYNSL